MKAAIEKNSILKLQEVILLLLMIALFSFFGCSDKPQPRPVQTAVTPPVKAIEKKVEEMQAMAAIQEPSVHEGYIYDQRERRDPFIPLIVSKKYLNKDETDMTGTLESYDLDEFTLAAIIKKGEQNFALVVAPDNRSFTINEGIIIGVNKGKVEEISDGRAVLVEYSKDYKGRLRTRRIILDFHKGE